MSGLVKSGQLHDDLKIILNIAIEWDLIAYIYLGDEIIVSKEQFYTLYNIFSKHYNRGTKYKHDSNSLLLNNDILLNRVFCENNETGGSILSQLIPYSIGDIKDICQSKENVDLLNYGVKNKVDIICSNKRIRSSCPDLIKAIEEQNKRISRLRQTRSSIFTRSANYMGSKKTLAPFLCEIISEFLPDNSCVLDLMCGSGVTAGFFARKWETYASDVQIFSQLLAVIQGGGFTVSRAQALLEKIIPIAKKHFEAASNIYQADLEIEYEYLTSEMTSDVKASYAKWIQEFPQICNSHRKNFPIRKLINIRRKKNSTYPYLLFIGYYANIFFGVRQSIEIDSIRYAIDKLDDAIDKQWALGALICATSACADNHSGHFAQPRVKIYEQSDIIAKLSKTLFKRRLSVFHEFEMRLISLSEESDDISHPINIINGPWATALDSFKKLNSNQKTLVYIDPPYKREEYSRYYHLLETLTRYNYPEVSGQALVPTKGSPNRFSSEFFTRNDNKATATITNILNCCLNNGWDTLLSYASSGIASIPSILDNIQSGSIDIFSSPALHSSQGSKNAKQVTEYLIYARK